MLYRYHADGTVRILETGTGLHTEYRYDRDKNLIRLQTSVRAGAGEKEKEEKKFLLDNRYAYDAAGNCIRKQCLEVETSFRYDSLQQLTEAVYPWGSERYTYDHAGNRLGLTAADRREEYRYDAAGRLAERLVFGRQEGPGKGKEKEENRTGDAGRTDAGRTDAGGTDVGTIGLGSFGNKIHPIYTNEQTFDGSLAKSLAGRLSHAEIGNAGSLKEVVCPTELVLSASYQYSYDKQGNTLSDGEHQYRYDSLNRLTEIETQNGDLQKNRYDGEGLRAELEENGELTRFLYSGRDVVAEQDEKNNIIRYVRGLELLSSDCECARTYYHYASDELGSITHVTDENGTVLNRYAYDAFGNQRIKEETVQNRFGFTGEICDGLTGQYYLRARFYNPVIGRFLNEDTYYGDGLNLYSYCRNNPVRYVDPSGHSCEGKEGGNTSNNSNKGIKPSFTDEEIANLKKTVIDEGQALKDMGITNNQLGPAIAGAYDKTTGKIYTAINDCDGKIPSELHPIIKERIESMPQEIYDSYIEHTKGAGSHAEVYAVNKALLANPEVDINNIVVYVNRTLGTSKPVIELPFKTCPHCRYILDGFNIISNNN